MRFGSFGSSVAVACALMASQAGAVTFTQDLSFTATFHNGLPYKTISGYATFEYTVPNGGESNIPFTVEWTGDVPAGPLVAGQSNGNMFGFSDGKSFYLTFYLPNSGAEKPYMTEAGYTDGTTYSRSYKQGLALGRVSLSAPVPEPASWAMMIAGFGLMGSTLRRRPRYAAS